MPHPTHSKEYKEQKLKEAQEFAKSKEGECLSTEYINNQTKLKFRCKKKHEWEAVFKTRTWCQRCSNTAFSIELAQELATNKMGKCLSTEYNDYNEKLIWECYNKHTWNAQLRCIVDGTWCPKCKISIGEEISRCVFEILFNIEFPKVRPDWLNGLEIDGYNEALKLGFEYDGIQHHEFVKRFHVTEDNFKKQQERDVLKDKLCKENKVNVIRISYKIEYNQIKNHICKECEKLKIKIPNNIDIDHTKLTKIYTIKDDRYQELKKMVEAKDGTLISTNYVHTDDKIQVKCEQGHIWTTTFHMIKNGKWCPHKRGQEIYTIENMHALAKKHEGKFLNDKYIDIVTSYLWECKKGHQWTASVGSIKFGKGWCPTCNDDQKKPRKTKKKNNNIIVV